ncbi:MAG: MiaB/RimO family radical SAM methylthiotransferase [Acidobacteriota bacterium]|nr:MiaB/RimO family radical SAM methylthiotransferase [Acidobacteriota bacterium]
MGRYYIATLGCKLNQFDSARAEGWLREGRHTPTDDPAQADLIVLNTCTVTMKADADGRRLARRLRRLNPQARIIATGCYAEREPRALEELGVLDEVVGLSQRERLPSLLGATETCSTASIDLFFGDRSRAFLRVQEGCDLACSYCVIPSVRGPSRSTTPETIVAAARRLARRGVREIGLTGVNTGSWGADLEPRRALSDLLETLLDALAGEAVPPRLRLNSLEPRTIDRRLLDLMATASPQIAPHLQIPLQSGSDRVLARMSRNYRRRHYRAVIEMAVERVPGICLGADVITGFPGEQPEDHRRTMAFIADLPLAYLHVFTYSPRPTTRAADLSDPVPERVAGRRTTELRTLGEEKARAFRAQALGRVLPALGLDAVADDGSRRALTANYIEVLVADAPRAELFDLRVTGLEDEGRVVRGVVA